MPDLWLRNRTAPQLRLLEGRGPAGLSLELVGTTANRDAVGARVELHTGGRVLVREVRAGDGYLAQSTSTLLFAPFAAASDPEARVVVRWPGGDVETVSGVRAGRFRLVQGAGTLEARPAREPVAALAEGALAELGESSARVVLRTGLPLPPPVLERLGAQNETRRPRLVNLWAHWCAPCIGELTLFAAHAGDIEATGLTLTLLNADRVEDHDAAERFFRERVLPAATPPGVSSDPASPALLQLVQGLIEHVVPGRGELSLPTSLLIDERGWLRVIYFGPLELGTLLADAASLSERGPEIYPGRWFFGIPRDLSGLSRSLARLGLEREARFYGALARTARREDR
ncbi:MAG: hypothetical protein GY711_16250 [bacterium]|nr:hypothetical protein [bacterium]